jgi:hypothetical protein
MNERNLSRLRGIALGGILLCLLFNSGREIMPTYIGVRTFPLLRSRHNIPSHFLVGKLMDIIRNLQIHYIFVSECFTFGYIVESKVKL